MWDAVFGGEETSLEGLSSVAPVKVAGFGNWLEELEGRGAVDRQIVDGFVYLRVIGDVGSLRKHGEDGFRVGRCEWFAL